MVYATLLIFRDAFGRTREKEHFTRFPLLSNQQFHLCSFVDSFCFRHFSSNNDDDDNERFVCIRAYVNVLSFLAECLFNCRAKANNNDDD